MSEGECDRACGRCERRASARRLRDRKGYEFPVVTDVIGRTHVYNSVPLDLTAALPEILEAGVAAVSLNFVDETPQQAATIVRHFATAIHAVAAGRSAPKPFAATATSGHFFRGVR
jgi:putative protease